MHTLLAALFALLFSTSHTGGKPVDPQNSARQAYTSGMAISDRASSRLASPHLHRVGSYAGSACVSCRRTNVSYRVR